MMTNQKKKSYNQPFHREKNNDSNDHDDMTDDDTEIQQKRQQHHPKQEYDLEDLVVMIRQKQQRKYTKYNIRYMTERIAKKNNNNNTMNDISSSNSNNNNNNQFQQTAFQLPMVRNQYQQQDQPQQQQVSPLYQNHDHQDQIFSHDDGSNNIHHSLDGCENTVKISNRSASS